MSFHHYHHLCAVIIRLGRSLNPPSSSSSHSHTKPSSSIWQTSRVIMKMDISYTDHSYIIGRGGNNIKRVMDDTKTHIHFPDSNRSNPTEKSNQVSLCGSLEGVERARSLIRVRNNNHNPHLFHPIEHVVKFLIYCKNLNIIYSRLVEHMNSPRAWNVTRCKIYMLCIRVHTCRVIFIYDYTHTLYAVHTSSCVYVGCGI